MPFGLGKKDNGQEKPQMTYEAKYIGGHKMYPKPTDVKVYIYGDRIKLSELNIELHYSTIKNVENMDEKKISAKRVIALGLLTGGIGAIAGAMWKKKHIYTVLEFTDALNQEQSLVLDFDKHIDKAQPFIYQKVLESRQGKSA